MFKKLSSILNNNYRSKENTHSLSNLKDGGGMFLSLIENWADIVGERLSAHTIPIKNRYNTLTILTDHSAFSQQLSFMEEVLKRKIIGKYPCFKSSIKRIKFQTNSVYFSRLSEDKLLEESTKKQEKEKFHKYSPVYRKLQAEAKEEFKDIESVGIKKILTSLFVQNRYKKESETLKD